MESRIGVFLNIFINDLESSATSGIANFVDNTKLCRVLKTRRDCKETQRDLRHITLGQ